MPVITRLIRINAVDESDWNIDLEDGVLAKMIEAQRTREHVTIECVAVPDGNREHAYYDIVLKDGTAVNAISGFHLADLNSLDFSKLS